MDGCQFCNQQPDYGPRDAGYYTRLGDHFAHKAADCSVAQDVRAFMGAAKDAFARAEALGALADIGVAPPDLARIAATRLDPWAFIETYLANHVTIEGKGISQSQLHAAMCEIALSWTIPVEGTIGQRDGLFAPRESGKSTILYLGLSLWATAHGWKEFVLGFSESATQAEQHLDTLIHELQNNELLRQDFPELCAPAIKTRGRTRADRVNQHISANGVIFMARGIDSASLGAKVENKRPDLILLDDIERGGGRYTPESAAKTLRTVRENILPMGLSASVVLVGTTTIADGIVHAVVKEATGVGDDQSKWLQEERFHCHYYPALINGESMWPERWPTADLLEMSGTRAFAAGYMGMPVTADGNYWQPSTFVYEEWEAYGPTILTIDPAVTTKTTSDRTALGVLSLSPEKDRIAVRDVIAGRWTSAQIRLQINTLLVTYPEIRLLVVETNQGGDLWDEILAGVPCKIDKKPQTEPKNIRAAKALSLYERGLVVHTKKLPEAEAEMTSFGEAPHDDRVDAITTGVEYLARRSKRPASGNRSESWVA